MTVTETRLGDLHDVLDGFGRIAVAVSGGVDSMTLATVTHRRVADATMFHAVSPAVPPEATERVRAYAGREGWRLRVVDAGEYDDPDYRANPVNRCFHCKRNLYGTIAGLTDVPIASGTNLDDLGDFRPGLVAAERHGVRHPFVEAGIDKATVRRVAAGLGLDDIADLPAAPCLSSRIETGIAIDADSLAFVHRVERLLTDGLSPRTVRCRVRDAGIVVELDPDALARLAERPDLKDDVAAASVRGGYGAAVGFTAYRMGSAFLR